MGGNFEYGSAEEGMLEELDIDNGGLASQLDTRRPNYDRVKDE